VKTLLHFGAGRIGRSLVGRLFCEAGWRITFVDILPPLVEALSRRRSYRVRIKDALPRGAPDTAEVTGFDAMLSSEAARLAEAVRDADLISTAVGAANVPDVLAALAPGLARRDRGVSILFVENLRHAGRVAREALGRLLPEAPRVLERVGLVETTTHTMVPMMPPDVSRRDPLLIWCDAYSRILADRRGFLDPPADVPGLVLKDPFPPWMDRKLFIHNLGHAAAAYHGNLAGKETIWECVAEERLRAETRAAMGESAWALAREYPGEFTEADLAAHADDLLRRFANRLLGDTVYRVGADLWRKLGPDDRLMGAMRLVEAHGGRPEHIARAVAAALRFKAVGPDGRILPRDEEFHRLLEARGLEAVLREVSGLDPGVPGDAALVDLVLRAYGSGV